MLRLLKAALVILVATIGFYFGQHIPFGEQWVIYNSLQVTAAIILGVMGAWAAIIYPGILSRIFKSQAEGAEVTRLRRLLIPMVYSAGVVAIVLLVGFFAPIAKRLPLLIPYTGVARGASYGMLGILTLLQLWALIFALAPGDVLMQNVERAHGKKTLLSKLQSRIGRR
jgi:hypothetical protein